MPPAVCAAMGVRECVCVCVGISRRSESRARRGSRDRWAAPDVANHESRLGGPPLDPLSEKQNAEGSGNAPLSKRLSRLDTTRTETRSSTSTSHNAELAELHWRTETDAPPTPPSLPPHVLRKICHRAYSSGWRRSICNSM